MFITSPLRPASTLALLLLTIPMGACGDDLFDTDFGGVDLAPFFFDSGLTVTQGGGPPRTMETQTGWLDGARASYYDFGWSASSKDLADPETRNRLGLSERDRIPKLALVNPIYFFFDSQRNPMFAEPQYETKTGYFFMVGGKGIRTLNPSPNAVRNLPYSLRERELLIDPNRKVADYQRPIIDVVFDRNRPELQQKYSGLWEVINVIAPPGYEPDAIKGWDTLEKGWNKGSGDFKLEPTEAAINCPLVDSRTLVIPSVAAFETGQLRDPQPRIELWYRQKRVFCFLVNGWPALGTTTEGSGGVDKYTLYRATDIDNAARFSVFDTEIFKQGRPGTAAERRDVVAPLGQLYVPTITTRSQPAFIPGHTVTTGALPKRTKDDIRGYRPVRWWWNLQVTEVGRDFGDGRYFFTASVGMNDIRRVDSSRLSPNPGLNVRNFPVVSQTVKCEGATLDNDPCSKIGQICSTLQGGNDENCVVKEVRYAEFCAPTVANCRTSADPKDNIESWFLNAAKLSDQNRDEVIPKEWQDARGGGDEGRLIDSGPNRRTYTCLRDTVSGMGHCYFICDGRNANTLQGRFTEPVTITTKGGRVLERRFALDSRCGGALMPGYRCLPVTDVPRDRGGSLCLRDCQTSEGEDVTDAVCQHPTPGYFSDGFAGKDASEFTKCVSTDLVGSGAFTACRKDAALAPY